MSRIPIGPVIEGVKKTGKFVKDNKKEIGAFISDVGSIGGAAKSGKKNQKQTINCIQGIIVIYIIKLKY
ncbi:hypothetical protein [Bacillus sp. T3]|uniref:hypothetical protein n=1 Tax=Bacillus sp. T3 TaxID=467262 RepID=UPI002980FE41|nr:hypothetical protein [Bacillus sp. T3]